MKKSDEPLLAIPLPGILAVIAAATLTLIVAEIWTWFISVQSEIWWIRAFRVSFELFLAILLCFTIAKKEATLLSTARRRESAEHQLELQAAALEAAANAILITDSAGSIIWVNRAFTELTGYTREEAIGKNPRMLRSGEHDQIFYNQLWSTIHSGQVWRGEIRNRKKDGALYTEDMTITPVLSEGQITHFVGIKQDVTAQKKLEAQYRQAQKMEAVGRLAGGVAHDFNNILGVIIGYCEVSLDKLEPEHPVIKNLAQIKVAGQRAASLTKQLLAFSRQQVVYPRVIDVNDVVERVADMLQRLVGDDVSIVLKLSRPLGNVKADVGQLEQVLMNLAVNARDAMADGGQITIETRNTELDEAYQREHEPVHPGHYVMLSFSDSGCGMDDETKSRAFEPFFTTKEAGRGTGLGLSTVYGIVKQSGGYVWVYSEPQQGTTLKLYFPRVPETVEERVGRPVLVGRHRGEKQTILLVEDEHALREFIAATLEDANYVVIQAANAEIALQHVREQQEAIHLLLTDVVMPKASGVKLMATLRAEAPRTKVILMSGYAGEMLTRYASVPENAAFLEKPFTRDTLLSTVYAVLHE